jgi:ribonuclease E
MRIWQAIEERARTVPTPALLYEESDLVIRCVRDLFTSDTDELLIDSEEAAKRAKDYLRIISPTYLRKVKFHEGPAPLFHKFGIEDEIDRIMRRKVNLKSGGALVIEQTEAMVVVDVNSGSYTEEKDAEETAFRTNMEAAPEIARQLRLRDLGGLIAIDFIDMKQDRHRRAVERELARAMRRDRARSKALHISRFGIVEMTRQRVRPGISLASQAVCPVCKGIGLVKSVESMALYLMRQVRMRLSKPDVESIEVITNPEVASFVLNTKRRDIVALETETGKSISIRSSAEHGAEAIEFNVTKTTKEKEATGKPHVRDRRPRRQPAQSARG